MPEPEPPRKILPSLVFHSRIDSMLSSTERMKQALHCGCSSKPDVEPHRRVEGRQLVQQDERQLRLERVAVLDRGEVAALTPPVGDRARHAADHLLDRALARRRVELPAEVLLGHDVRRVLRPRRRELHVVLAERADGCGARLPLDGLERMDTGLGEQAPHGQGLAGAWVLRECGLRRLLHGEAPFPAWPSGRSANFDGPTSIEVTPDGIGATRGAGLECGRNGPPHSTDRGDPRSRVLVACDDPR